MATAKATLSELTYPDLVRELFPRLTGGVRWGLERTHALLASVGNPHQSYRSIHVGGTNGKGSVAATLASIIAADGDSVGLYSSPHLCSFRERIQIDQNAIGETAVVAAARKLWPAIQQQEPSFFEATTAIALLAFAEAGIDTAVVEVGLGGRLDSTNVIEPQLSIVTNIAFDHADYLGNTLVAIATEKAGIIKPDVPFLTAEPDTEMLEVFRSRTSALAAPMHVLQPDEIGDVSFDLNGTTFQMPWHEEQHRFRTPLIGQHQASNTALALRAVELLDVHIDQQSVARALGSIKWPGRLQIEVVGSQRWVFDVAHNVAGVHALVDCLRALDLPRPVVLVLGILGDKDWRAMLPPLFAAVEAVILTIPPTAPANRAWDPHLALAYGDSDHVRVVADFHQALEAARTDAGRGTVLVTGSFHTVGDALICLNRTPFGSDVTLPRVSFAG